MISLIIVHRKVYIQYDVAIMFEVDMSSFEKEWTVESAMEILQHPTVDSKIWAEAVEWLMVYGPQEIKEMLHDASSYATSKEFPDLQPEGFSEKGELLYSVADVARVLHISEEEAAEIIAAKQEKHGIQQFIDKQDVKKVQ